MDGIASESLLILRCRNARPQLLLGSIFVGAGSQTLSPEPSEREGGVK
jgi:hypothetical protein